MAVALEVAVILAQFGQYGSKNEAHLRKHGSISDGEVVGVGKYSADAGLRKLEGGGAVRGIYWSNKTLAPVEYAQATIKNRAKSP